MVGYLSPVSLGCLAVAVSERVRKIVWVQAGGRCAVCQRQVLTPGTEADDPSIFGEEAHIVARSPGGPRAGGLDNDQLDGHENLILLCREHHKQVDDQPNRYTVERLRQIKQKHTEWVASLGVKEPKSLRVVPDPGFQQPQFLHPCGADSMVDSRDRYPTRHRDPTWWTLTANLLASPVSDKSE